MEITHLYSVHDTYNRLKEHRDINLEVLRVAENDPYIHTDVIAQLEVETDFLTETLAMIDRGRGMPTEDDL